MTTNSNEVLSAVAIGGALGSGRDNGTSALG